MTVRLIGIRAALHQLIFVLFGHGQPEPYPGFVVHVEPGVRGSLSD